jgi:hypothetical protein
MGQKYAEQMLCFENNDAEVRGAYALQNSQLLVLEVLLSQLFFNFVSY